eukprot:gnl/MRDRNA2_/MRDRNA2_118310_c0_seq1.p2 gnl/MRDRNA2_/MRDRNA2_118310_c0~~gnl/MRDRNA2_/MRDRNA2_118310_c0_seq1.p2  ORF type:complete len:261 (-),score=57.04 gnl/MRDRNA2_/MRDRNA2_118310_c0_seq1:36-818(-)
MNVEVAEGEGKGAPAKRKLPAKPQMSNTAWQAKGMQHQGKGGGKAKGKGGAASHRPAVYMGTVKSFNHKTFYGFIQCDDLMDTYGSDVFCMGDEIGHMDFGQVVTFELKINDKGKPQAMNVVPVATGKSSLPAKTQQFSPVQQNVVGKSKGKSNVVAKGKGKSKTPANEGEPLEGLGEYYTGIVKSFNHQTNFGFIDCEETHEVYGCDVFCRGKEIGHLDFGTTVTFELALSSKGQPQAMNVEVAEGVEQPPAKRPKLSR